MCVGGGGELFFSFWEVLREVRDFITHLSCIHYIYIQYNSAVKSGNPTFEGGGGGGACPLVSFSDISVRDRLKNTLKPMK